MSNRKENGNIIEAGQSEFVVGSNVMVADLPEQRPSDFSIKLALDNKAGEIWAKSVLYQLSQSQDEELARKSATAVLGSMREVEGTNIQINFGFPLEIIR